MTNEERTATIQHNATFSLQACWDTDLIPATERREEGKQQVKIQEKKTQGEGMRESEIANILGLGRECFSISEGSTNRSGLVRVCPRLRVANKILVSSDY